MTDQQPSETAIREFWAFFLRSAPFLAKNVLNDKMQEELNRQVSRLGEELTWEVGPGRHKPNALTISPGGDRDLLPITRRVVAAAACVDGWEFHPAKPPKEWDLRLILQVGDERFEIDARRWRYALLDYGDGVFDLTLEARNADALDHAIRMAAAEAVVEGILGEERRIETIGSLEVVSRMETELAEESGPISHLAEHVGRVAR